MWVVYEVKMLVQDINKKTIKKFDKVKILILVKAYTNLSLTLWMAKLGIRAIRRLSWMSWVIRIPSKVVEYSVEWTSPVLPTTTELLKLNYVLLFTTYNSEWFFLRLIGFKVSIKLLIPYY